MSADEILLDVEERMEKAVGVLKNDLAGIRTGRANPGLVDSLRVEVYGSPTPIKQIASVGAPEPTQIVIRPYDPGTLKDIEKAILASDLGFNPQNDGRRDPHQRAAAVDRSPPQDGRPHPGAGRRGQGRHPQHPPRRQQGGRSGGKGQGAHRRRTRPGQRRGPGADQEVRRTRRRTWPPPRKKRSWRTDAVAALASTNAQIAITRITRSSTIVSRLQPRPRLGVLTLAGRVSHFCGCRRRVGVHRRRARQCTGRSRHRPSRRQQDRSGKHAAGLRFGRPSGLRPGRARLPPFLRRRAGRVSRRRPGPLHRRLCALGAARRSCSVRKRWRNCARWMPASGFQKNSPARAFPRSTSRSTPSKPDR